MVVHPADIQDRDGAELLLRQVHRPFLFIERIIGDAGHQGPGMRGEIAYFHLDLGPHDCMLANGAWAESYFEDRNRDAFHNADEYRACFPGHVPQR